MSESVFICFNKYIIPILGVVENMGYYQASPADEKVFVFGRGGGERLAQEIDAPFFGSVPLEPEISHMMDHGEPLFKTTDSRGKIQKIFTKLALEVIEKAKALEVKNGFGAGEFEINWTDTKETNHYSVNPENASKKIQEPINRVQEDGKAYIQSLQQRDNCTFTIQWTDGKAVDYRLAELQAICPCARCVDEETGKRRALPLPIRSDLRAKGVRSVGRYAIRIDFAEGCSHGIYDFALLRTHKGLMP